ncbi:MAG TPA: polysaccharide deacetylase family protein, partial [Gaiellales bacterium]|nr:polysaccharide deacetylase family protein [Gaiellales bacterium]
AVVHEILAGGNEIGVHCDRHRNLLRLAPGQTVADLNAAERTIVEVADRPCSLYRPPYGILTAAAVVHARRRGWSTLLWNRHGRDWRPEATPETIAAGVGGGFRPGDVVLLHDSDFYSGPGRWRHTVAALPAILAAVAASGLSTCLPEAPA